ncbi:MAG TPA: M48 family metalloprotease, partial [Myxococcaceae bacterium]|nr:M48 family metalloprotease [Myxococcaceae bacterium]
MPRLIHLVLISALAAPGCVKNPATGERQLSLISQEQEIALGQQAKQEVAQSIGLYDSSELQSYVSGLGKKLAAASERPALPWSFQVVDDASVNAFALPGGPIFVTRGILTHLNSEAELAAVLGHEIGHVTGRHAANMISKQQLAQLGLGIGTILLPEGLRGLGQLAGAGMGLMFLKYGRDAENQADELGFRYTLKTG